MKVPDPSYGQNWSAQATDIVPQPGVNATPGQRGQVGPQGVAGTNGATGPAGPSVLPSGATGARPSSPATGAVYLDTTLDKPVFFNGTNWIDATGATV
jgi:hypothetical protein